jgi:hypothetical protein
MRPALAEEEQLHYHYSHSRMAVDHQMTAVAAVVVVVVVVVVPPLLLLLQLRLNLCRWWCQQHLRRLHQLLAAVTLPCWSLQMLD